MFLSRDHANPGKDHRPNSRNPLIVEKKFRVGRQQRWARILARRLVRIDWRNPVGHFTSHIYISHEPLGNSNKTVTGLVRVQNYLRIPANPAKGWHSSSLDDRGNPNPCAAILSFYRGNT
jgi:hypothetical protein